MESLTKVSISRADSLEWHVSLDGVVVRTFPLVTEALHYAALLECDPRIRKEAVLDG